jgi:hypothetical protein
MSLQCLAIIGKANEPLYLIDVEPPKDEGSNDAQDENDDAFGFAAAHRQDRLSLRKEVGVLVQALIVLISFPYFPYFSPSDYYIASVVHDACIHRQLRRSAGVTPAWRKGSNWW